MLPVAVILIVGAISITLQLFILECEYRSTADSITQAMTGSEAMTESSHTRWRAAFYFQQNAAI